MTVTPMRRWVAPTVRVVLDHWEQVGEGHGDGVPCIAALNVECSWCGRVCQIKDTNTKLMVKLLEFIEGKPCSTECKGDEA